MGPFYAKVHAHARNAVAISDRRSEGRGTAGIYLFLCFLCLRIL